MTVNAVWNHRPIQDIKIYVKYIKVDLMVSKDFHMHAWGPWHQCSPTAHREYVQESEIWFPAKTQGFPPPIEGELAFPVEDHLHFQMRDLNKQLDLKRLKSLAEKIHKMQNSTSSSLIPVSQTLQIIPAKGKITKLNKASGSEGGFVFLPLYFCWKSCISWSQ